MIKKLNKFIILTALLFQLTNIHADATADQNNLAAWQAAAQAFNSQGTPTQLLQKQGKINAGTAKALAGSSPQGQALGLYLASGNSARNATSFPGNEGLDAALGLNLVINPAANGSSSTSTKNTTSTANKVETQTPVVTPTNTPVATPTNTPVVTPTNTPVAAPTNTPVVTPTNTPVVTPTNTPVAAPTNTPVAAPKTITAPTTDSIRTGLQGQISTLNDQISTLKGQINGAQQQITTLNAQLSTLNAQLATLNAQLAALPA